jgi:hypothetical protein
VNWSASEVDEVDAPTVAVTSTVPDPAEDSGTRTEHDVEEEHAADDEAALPKSKLVPPVEVEKPVPDTVTETSPDTGPLEGDTPVTVGAPGAASAV